MAFRQTGMSLWRTPEFKAFREMLGIPDLPTRRLVIEIPCFPEDVVKVTHEYLSNPIGTEDRPVSGINNTTTDNKRFETKQPGERPDRML